jgi:predicted GNAT family N-acyltransferase
LVGTKEKHRVCWYAKDSAQRLEALCIVKKETETLPPEAIGKVLKICSLKVAEAARGRSLGEQLLKAAFAFAYENNYDTVFLTIFEDKQPRLVQDLVDFGFQVSAHRLARNEGQMYKFLAPPPGAVQSGLSAHIAYGPKYVDFNQPVMAIPIQPRYVEQLFPEKSSQTALLPRASANAIRKAYLSMARRKGIAPGTVLAFYRSQVDQGLIVVGVVERAETHTTADGVAGFVGKRTVYTFREIENMVNEGPVFAIRFREARLVTPVIPLSELKARGMLKAAPQSITSMTLTEETRSWLEQRTRG